MAKKSSKNTKRKLQTGDEWFTQNPRPPFVSNYNRGLNMLKSPGMIPNPADITYPTPDAPAGTVTSGESSYAPDYFANNVFTTYADQYDADPYQPGIQQGPVGKQRAIDLGYKEQKVDTRWRNPFENVKGRDVLNMIPYVKYDTFGLYAANAFLRKQDAIRDQQNYQRRLRNVFTQKPIYDYNYLYGPDSSGGTQYQSMIMAKNGANIRRGTSPDITDVEVEGGEFIQLPNMNTQHVEGPSHAKGGVHTNLPEGARVFSDFLKPAGSKKTYAQLAKKYDTQKWKDILENPYSSDIDRNTAKLIFDRYERVLSELFNDQQLQNGNSDGTDQAMDDMGGIDIQRTAQEGMIYESPADLEGYIQSDLNQILPPVYLEEPDYEQDMEIEPEANYEEGGQYLGGVAEFYGGGYFMDGGQFPMMGDNASTFYNGVMPDPSIFNNTTTTQGSPAFGQVGMQKTAATATAAETPTETAKELIEKIKNNPELAKAVFNYYRKDFKNENVSLEDLLNSFVEVTDNIYQIRSKASEAELRDIDLDKGTKNSKYKELAKKYGVSPITGENKIKKFQQVYRSLAKLQEDPLFKKDLETYELTPIGVDDTKWQGSLYSGKGISLADSWFGNTTLGQLLRRKQLPPTTPAPRPVIPEESKPGNVMKPVYPVGQTMSTMGRFPAYQAIPNVMGYLAGLNPYSYYTPDLKPAYIAPPTLNIDSELQSIDDTVYAMMNQTTGNPSIDNSRNTALFNQALAAKQQAFSRKQNYDANARGETDKFNALSAADANNKNVLVAAQIKNEYMASAQDLAEAERLGAIFNLTDKYGKYQQDEYLKMLYFDSLIPNYYYNGRDPRNPINLDPLAPPMYQPTRTVPTIPTNPEKTT